LFQIYQPSGRFSPSAFVILLGGAVVASAAAYVYQLGLQWIPFIYVNFLLTWGMGMLLGKAAAYFIYAGHVRNVALGLAGFVILVAVGLGSKFGFQYLAARAEVAAEVARLQPADLGIELDRPLNGEELANFRQAILEDFTFGDHIQARVDRGWNVGRAGGAPVAGIFVYLVWLVELGVISYFGGTLALEAVRKPYSETLGKWADSVDVEMTLPVTNPLMVAKIGSAKTVQELLELPIPDTDESSNVAVYVVHSVPNFPEEDAYLSVELQKFSQNAKGETEVTSEKLVNLAVITAAQRAQLRENSELMQEALAAYRESLANRPPEAAEDAPPDSESPSI